MAVIGIDHVQLAMPLGREDAAGGFYERLLGLKEVAKPPHLAARGGFEGNGVRIHLGVEDDFSSARKAHPGLVVSDLPSLAAMLGAAGFPTSADQPLEGYDRRYVSGPFGNRIELMQVK
ncbi:glyoxalase [Rhizobium tubonense]|uniref:Glyoxalase n=1 Tax=Rhizobium tubonense TaxID=484088 RepID=A0A2W4E5Z4_9HYPH|nr:glyoxalase [Rhizobium tubonense]PZM10886.1 glyoxalase [Rhizobium tubonense]